MSRPDYERIRDRVRTYLRIMKEGHNPKVKEKDIRYGFKMRNRTENFDIGLDVINAHTFKIMEIIEQEKTQMMTKNNDLQGLKNHG